MMHRGITFHVYIPIIVLIVISYGSFWFYKSHTHATLPIFLSPTPEEIDIDTYLAEQKKYLRGG